MSFYVGAIGRPKDMFTESDRNGNGSRSKFVNGSGNGRKNICKKFFCVGKRRMKINLFMSVRPLSEVEVENQEKIGLPTSALAF